MGRTLQLHNGQHLTIEGTGYRVTGGIEYHNRSDGSRWTEYCLQELQTSQVRWLSVDNIYGEYAIYTQHPYSSEFEEMNIFRISYRQADSGNATVTSCFGNVDAEPGDTVSYTEYEDGAEERIIAVEKWEDETEYSKGYYLDLDEIEPMESGNVRSEAFKAPPSGAGPGFLKPKTLIVGAALILLFVTAGFMHNKANQKTIQKYLETTPLFAYQTSITSNLNSKEKANVYATSMSVDEAVKAIIQSIDGETEDVQKSDEDDSVAILTKDEYCLVYTSTDQITTAQISSRAYAYQSTNTPYHASPYTHSYYRGFYYTRGFYNDRGRYSRSASGYDGYSGEGVQDNPNDPYKSYSDSVRQSSINSRRSSGGGISSGK